MRIILVLLFVAIYEKVSLKKSCAAVLEKPKQKQKQQRLCGAAG